MKIVKLVAIGAVILSISGLACAACFGWILEYRKMISMNEALCVYEKSGVQQKFIVKGFCPMSPPGCSR